jgi:hypothetical protein
MSNSKPDECVGSLLVHQQDMRELSSKTLTGQHEAVGTLLVNPSELKELSSKANTSNDQNGDSKQEGGLLRRITKKLNEPAPDMDEADLWEA